MKTILCLFILGISKCLQAQKNSSNCSDLRDGVYYHYAVSDKTDYVYIREGGFQKEINLSTGDTALWKVEWKRDCFYRLEFLDGQGPAAAFIKTTSKKIIVDVEVLNSNDQYYVFKTLRDKKLGVSATLDTIWRKEQPLKLREKNIVEAFFPGGNEAWNDYLTKALNQQSKKVGRVKQTGICFIRFSIEPDGTVSNVKAMTMQNSLLAKIGVDIIKNSSKWIPGTINGEKTRMIRVQPIELQQKAIDAFKQSE